MNILYKPVKIESAEQAEALPEGTVAICPEDWPVEKSGGLWGRQGYPSSFLADTGDWAALVPIEVEEQRITSKLLKHPPCLDDLRAFQAGETPADRTRLVTPWEAT